MNRRALYALMLALLIGSQSQADIGVPLQLRLASPTGVYPTESGLSFRLIVLSPGSNCILREEIFSAQSISEGNISLTLGTGTRGSNDPNINLIQVYNNSQSKPGLSCVDGNNNIVLTNQTYAPAQNDHRIMRISTTINADNIIANFDMRATPYSVQAESIGGKVASDLIVKNDSTEMNQTNLETLLLNTTHLNNLITLATSGAAANATNATNATSAVNFTGALVGDVNGTQNTTSVDRIKGIPVSSITPLNGHVLRYDGSQYVPSVLPTAPVTSVAGKTGVVTLVATDISGLGTSASLNVGVAPNNVVQLDGAARIPASTLPTTALTTSSSFAGDISGTSSSVVVDQIKGVPVNAAPPVARQALVYNGSEWVPTTGFPYFFKSTANQTFSTNALTDVTSLSFPLSTGLIYKYRFHILYTSPVTTTGLRVSLTYPAVTTASAVAQIPSGNDGTGSQYQGTINFSGDIVTSPSTSTANTVHYASVQGVIIPSADGTMQLRAASEVNGSNIIIRAGSFAEINVVP